MTFISGVFNSWHGDRRYLAEFFAEYFASFIGNGVFINPSNALQVVAGDGMTTIIKSGKCWVNGYYGRNSSDYVMQHDLADGVLRRIDRIVLRLDFEERRILPQLKKGAYASTPVAPTLQRDADAYELALADVLIDRGATQITQANITDLRLDNELCGRVHGVVDQVDTTTLFNQYQSWIQQQKDIYEEDLENWTADQQADFLNWREDEEGLFNDWVESIKDILDENVAGNLLQMIEDFKAEFDAYKIQAQLDNLQTSREIANLKLYQDANQRVENGVVFGTNFDGNNLDLQILNKVGYTTGSIPIGTTTVTLRESAGFVAGEFVMLYDDVNHEERIITDVSQDGLTLTFNKATAIAHKPNSQIKQSTGILYEELGRYGYGKWERFVSSFMGIRFEGSLAITLSSISVQSALSNTGLYLATNSSGTLTVQRLDNGNLTSIDTSVSNNIIRPIFTTIGSDNLFWIRTSILKRRNLGNHTVEEVNLGYSNVISFKLSKDESKIAILVSVSNSEKRLLIVDTASLSIEVDKEVNSTAHRIDYNSEGTYVIVVTESGDLYRHLPTSATSTNNHIGKLSSYASNMQTDDFYINAGYIATFGLSGSENLNPSMFREDSPSSRTSLRNVVWTPSSRPKIEITREGLIIFDANTGITGIYDSSKKELVEEIQRSGATLFATSNQYTVIFKQSAPREFTEYNTLRWIRTDNIPHGMLSVSVPKGSLLSAWVRRLSVNTGFLTAYVNGNEVEPSEIDNNETQIISENGNPEDRNIISIVFERTSGTFAYAISRILGGVSKW